MQVVVMRRGRHARFEQGYFGEHGVRAVVVQCEGQQEDVQVWVKQPVEYGSHGSG